jgi:hypothetical protein
VNNRLFGIIGDYCIGGANSKSLSQTLTRLWIGISPDGKEALEGDSRGTRVCGFAGKLVANTMEVWRGNALYGVREYVVRGWGQELLPAIAWMESSLEVEMARWP